jgi:hypothetical protein
MAQSIQRGVPVKLFDAVSPNAGDLSISLALPNLPGIMPLYVTWRTAFASNPSAINVVIQQAMNDVAAEYATIDTSTYTSGGEQRIISPVTGRFIRAKQVSNTGGTGLTVEVLV